MRTEYDGLLKTQVSTGSRSEGVLKINSSTFGGSSVMVETERRADEDEFPSSGVDTAELGSSAAASANSLVVGETTSALFRPFSGADSLACKRFLMVFTRVDDPANMCTDVRGAAASEVAAVTDGEPLLAVISSGVLGRPSEGAKATRIPFKKARRNDVRLGDAGGESAPGLGHIGLVVVTSGVLR